MYLFFGHPLYIHIYLHTYTRVCIYLISYFTGNLKSDVRLCLSEEAFLEEFMSTCRDLGRNLRNAVYFIKLLTGNGAKKGP